MSSRRRILFAVDQSVCCRSAFQWFLQWMWRAGARRDEGRRAEGKPEEEDAITFIHVISSDLNPHPSSEMAMSMSVTGRTATFRGQGVPLVMEEAFETGKMVCETFLHLAMEAGATSCDACIVVDQHSATGKAILRSARIRGADVIVVGSHGHGAVHRAVHLGSVVKYITRHSRIPVVVIPPEACPPPQLST